MFKYSSGHNGRVKDMDMYVVDGTTYLVSCSTDGNIRIWNLSDGCELVGEYDAKCRLTCVKFATPGVVTKKEEVVEDVPVEVDQSDFEDEVTAIHGKRAAPVVSVQIEEGGKVISVSKSGGKKKMQKKKAPAVKEKKRDDKEKHVGKRGAGKKGSNKKEKKAKVEIAE
jgi:WD40 repeat protein